MNEAETRAEHIDPALKAAGSDVVQRSHIRSTHLKQYLPQQAFSGQL